MPLTVTEHYAISAACFIGGTLSVVTHLWLIFDFLPQLRINKNLRQLHLQLIIANLFVTLFFFASAISHFEQAWIFGPFFCKFYVFWCKFTPVAAVGQLAVCLYGEYKSALEPSVAKNRSYKHFSFLAWANGLFWGVGAITMSKYGQEPAGFTCTVIWYQVQPYVTYMTVFGFCIPIVLAAFYAYKLWSNGLLFDNPLAKSAVGLLFTMNIQFAGYALGYVVVCLSWELSLYSIAFATVWTKICGVAHPFVYSNMFAYESVDEKKD